MDDSLKLPFLNEVIPSGLRYGANYLVEFEPHSLWFETSLNLCAQGLRMGVRTDYHTLSHPPDDVRRQLGELNLPVEKLESDDTLRIWDSYTMQTGTRDKASVGKAVPRDFIDVQSMKLTDWQGEKATLAKEVLDVDKRRLHVDDNTAVLVQFNDEKMVFEYFRTRTVPYARKAELAVFHALVKGAYSDGFYNQFEAFCDGIIDLKAQEEGGRLEQYIRVRALRGKTFDSRWHRIRLSPDGEVVYSGISFGL